MKTSKKLLSFFLAVVMVVTTCSVGFTAFAKDNKNSIWSTSCKANEAYDTLNTLVDTYLPAALLGNETVGPAIYAKFAAAIGVKVEKLTAHQKAVIAGTEQPAKGDHKNLRAATVQDVLGVLQPILISALYSTPQDKYANIAYSENQSLGKKDPSYFDYLKKYVTVNGKQEEDTSSMSFYTLYGLCRNFKDNEDLSKSTRDTLSKWYDALKTISYLVPDFDINDAQALIDKLAKDFEDKKQYGVEYSTSVDDLASFFDKAYENALSKEDKDMLQKVYPVCQEELAFFGITDVKVDTIAELLFYGCNNFRCSDYGSIAKYNNLYFNLIESAKGKINYNGTKDFFGWGTDFEFAYDKPITRNNYVVEFTRAYLKANKTLTDAQIVKLFGAGVADLSTNY